MSQMPLHRRSAVFGRTNTWNSRVPERIKAACVDPDNGLLALDKYESEQSLKSFVRMMWPVLEPGRKLIDGWLLDALCEHYEAIHYGHIRKLLINVPPGCMKSILGAVFSAWQLGPMKRPHYRYLATSYSGRLSLRDNERCRNILQSPQFLACWGDTCRIDPANNAKGLFKTTQKGFRYATSVKGTGTGERGDVVIMDDLHNIKNVESEKEREDVIHYVAEVLPTRVNDPETAAFLGIMQRSHEADASGHILSMMDGWTHLCIPMEYDSDHPYKSNSIYFKDPRTQEGELIWPDRFTRRYLEEDLKPALRSWGGDYAVAAQLQQRPVARGGNMFKREFWRFYETQYSGRRMRPIDTYKGEALPLPDRFDRIIASVDAAFKGAEKGSKRGSRSRVAIGIIGTKGPYRYILECLAKHMEVDETCNAIATFAHEADCTEECRELESCPRIENRRISGGVLSRYPNIEVIVEDKANGPAIIRLLGQRVSGLVPINPQGGKEARANAMLPAIKSGHYFLPDGVPWVVDFVSNFASFPAGTYDDEIDMVSQAHIHMFGSHASTRARMMSSL